MTYEQKDRILKIGAITTLIIGIVLALISIVNFKWIGLFTVGLSMITIAPMIFFFIGEFMNHFDTEKIIDGNVIYPNVAKLYRALKAYKDGIDYFAEISDDYKNLSQIIKDFSFEKNKAIERIIVDDVSLDRDQEYTRFCREMFLRMLRACKKDEEFDTRLELLEIELKFKKQYETLA